MNATQSPHLYSCDRCSASEPISRCRPVTVLDEQGRPIMEIWCPLCQHLMRAVVTEDDGEIEA